MADQYVSRVKVFIDGQEMEDFKTWSDDGHEVRAAVNLMHKTGYSKRTARYGFKLGYVPASATPEYDFDAVEDATVAVVVDEGTRRIVYGGVVFLGDGEMSIDGENETVVEKRFSASTRRYE
jgi:hypothetical protein